MRGETAFLGGSHVTRSTTADAINAPATPITPAQPADAGFGAEFRELARQRRFVREASAGAERGAATTPAPAAPKVDWRAAAPARPEPATYAERVVARPIAEQMAPPAAPRMSNDAAAMITELARMSDRLVESREALATERARAEHAEEHVRAADGRLMAAQALVHDAQRAMHASAERVAWLDGRNATLQEALEIAVHAGPITRLRWRRQRAAAARG